VSSLKKIAVIENIVQAQMLETLLNELGIPHLLRSYHDSAYDGLFQGQKGWGHVEASAMHEAEILSLLGELRAQPTESPGEPS
jgi:hypothetical protein